ncbi:adenylate/guanylate cyclase domain-containing protein [[Phormidium] sp. ETS-05]|uniref:adenylate/guanylate cyclase domain-containing protein n=1 Tax=[Phormidium] sp. ETS-05 TaxID=222819 RepID=UPI001E594F6C|nr:adenylate/guanylate cyclase domain-containing protein [[Phormidium] sp. ETS-05]
MSHIRQFLTSLKIGKSGQTFIVERSGLLVASSTPQLPFVVMGDKVERVQAADVDDFLLRETARYLEGKFGNWRGITEAQQLDFTLHGERYFLQVVPFADGENLSWLIVVVVPEADFMERIRANNVMTLRLCLVALAIAIVVGGLTARWITQPIWRLSKASMAIANGNFEQQVEIDRRDELGILANAFNQMTAQIKFSQAELAEYSRSLEMKVRDRTLELQQEKEKSEELLLNILPQKIAERLKRDQSAIADYFDEVTILFADIVGFTPLSSRISPIDLVNLLNRIFSNFDHLAERYRLEKIKTIGDAYMVVGGLPKHRQDHAEAVANMALEMQAAINQLQAELGESLQIRIGINTGPVVAGVIGIKKFIYDLWGDTVNVASRMESSGLPGKIQVTVDTYKILHDQYLFEPRGLIEVKGKGEMMTYWLLSRQPGKIG